VLAGSTPDRASIARVPGRVVLDGIATLKSATYSFERYTLEYVSRELLGRGKKIAKDEDAMAEIRRMFAEDQPKLAEYNLEDCRLVLDIFAKADLLGFAMERARLTGLPMDRQGGSVAAFDHLYLPRLHRRGYVARDVEDRDDFEASPGGHVLDSVPGLYHDVLSFDFRSLYPSIIRTFRIDPLRLARPEESPILPELIAMLHDARKAATDPARSRAIKILMNSFYGVLGTPGCRFFDSRLPTAITTRGHAIIERARAFFEGEGFTVLYGDTDSLFVHAAKDGPALAARLNALLAEEIRHADGVESHLELRFESHYLRFLMPTTRGSDRGSKKRYAGLIRKSDGSLHVVVRGLEAVRRDWAPLARRVQVELLRRVFTEEPFEEWLRETVRDLREGRLDDELVYNRPIERAGDRIDYDYYVDKQLAPVCDVVLGFTGTSFEKIAGRQTSLF
jgi:DNA polymerase-2